MMDISHLYHDAAFGDPSLELDVKEQLKTREVNAREERNLQRLQESYERAKCIFEKNIAWERWRVGQSLAGIWERSPRLEKRLAVEKARIEALERSILYRNYRMDTTMTHTTNTSFNSRTLTSVSLKPLQEKKIRKQRRREKADNEAEEGKTNSNVNPEKGFFRQPDFVRRSEHSIKTLAKLNWKQQTRRRDHEKFKEELFFHSKPVIDKAKVILKGRQDIDVENLSSDFENIFLPPVKKPVSLNSSFKSFTKHQRPSTLSEKSVFLVTDSPDRQSYASVSELSPVTENTEDKEKEMKQNDHTQSLTHDSNKDTGDALSEEIGSPEVRNDNVTNSGRITQTTQGETSDENNLSENAQVPHGLFHSNSPNHIGGDVKIPDKTDSPQSCDQAQHLSPFSPSTSVSQVIMEEDEEEAEEENSMSQKESTNENQVSIRERVPVDFNNNNNNAVNLQESGDNDKKPAGLYTIACTTGLPKLWKQAVKTKEKPPAEVSVAALGRKHRKKRKDRLW